MRVLAIFGPTAVGKTGVAIEVAELLRERGEDPVAISCDSIQVYRGLEILSGARERRASARGSSTGCSASSPIDGEFSAGRFAELAHAEIDAAARRRAAGRSSSAAPASTCARRSPSSSCARRCRPRSGPRSSAELAERGPEALHAELAPELASGVHPNDRKRIVAADRARPARDRAARRPARACGPRSCASRRTLVGLTVDRDELRARIDARVEAMVAAGAERGGAQRRRRRAPRAPPARRSASRSCSPATSRR